MALTYFFDLKTRIAGQLIAQVGNLPITELLIDQYKPYLTAHPLFFCLTNHPKSYASLEQAYAQGVRQFVLDQQAVNYVGNRFAQSNILQVDHPQKALCHWLTWHRAKYKGPLLAILGSYGKTTIKEWLSKGLAQRYNLLTTPHSHNTPQQLALTLSLLDHTHNYAMVEVDLEKSRALKPLVQWLQPTTGLLTNLSTTPNQTFLSLQQKAEAYVPILNTCKTIFYCKAYTLLHQVIQTHYGSTKTYITWDFKAPADYVVNYMISAKGQTKVQLTHKHHTYTFFLPFTHSHALENSIHSLVYLLAHNWPIEPLQALLTQWPYMPLHLVSKQGPKACYILEDPYGQDLLSLACSLELMQQAKLTKTVILMDIAPFYHNPIYCKQLNSLLVQYQVQRLIGIGFTFKDNATLFTIKTHWFKTKQAFMANMPIFLKDYILIKGTQPKAITALIDGIHHPMPPTTLTINMAALLDNLHVFKGQLKAKTKILAMVKANAYGHGSVPIAWALQPHIDYFGVTFVQEAIPLRNHGIHLPIMVMTTQPEDWPYCLAYNLEPVFYSLELLYAFAAFIKANAIPAWPIHLKLDTGMHRLGFDQSLLPKVAQLVHHHPALQIISLLSHLSSAAIASHDKASYAQIALFDQMVQMLEGALPKRPLKHLLNSNGIVRFPQYQWDMVRLGIGLYGIGMTNGQALQATDTLTTQISQVKTIQPGAAIGYNRKAIISKPTTIAILPIGYADGLRRAFGKGKGKVLIQGKLCPTIGEICMDMTLVDVSGLAVQSGDQAIIFSPSHSLEQLAQSVEMTAYEYISQIGPRITRYYHW